jgi:geranylgeranyl pyrophosphate synthase
LLDDADRAEVRRGFADLLRAEAASEPHLRGVLRQAVGHPGSLVRAQLAFGILLGHDWSRKSAVAVATAIEYFHTASLIFDDLPCMDDAATRRGHACPHRVHGEAAAVLGALALINRAYELLWSVLAALPVRIGLEGSRIVAVCLGAGGILDGQARDLHFEGITADEAGVTAVAEGKTVPLVRLTLLLPAVMADAAPADVAKLDQLSRRWGLSYQILDDFKDAWTTGAETGKTAGMDRRHRRANLPAAAGVTRALSRLDSLLAEAREIVSRLGAQDRRWSVLERLQCILENEDRKIRSRPLLVTVQ